VWLGNVGGRPFTNPITSSISPVGDESRSFDSYDEDAIAPAPEAEEEEEEEDPY
jgi:hypothetical protein